MRQEPATEAELTTAQPIAPIPDPSLEGSTRRGLLAGVGIAGVAGVLAACGGGNESGDSGSGSGGGGGDSGSGGSGGGGGQSNALAKTSDIPVRGGKVFKDEKVVITQPSQGEFRCFSAVCTHRGCDVDSVDGGTINCPCHGSKFSVEDASVQAGPASKPLTRKEIKVEGDSIVLF
jgi:nitrite reductase/ring-hydroxylating ferredoxin subunit